MAEIKEFWICHEPTKIDGSFAHYWEDDAIKDEDHRLAQIGPSPEGMSIHKLIRVYDGTTQARWEKEKTKVYDNYADAKKDAEGRMKRTKKKYEAEKGAKTASELTDFQDAIIASRIASRVAGK